MNKSNKFSPEARERAVRMVQEHRGEYPSLWAAVESMAPKIGCVPQTLLSWVQRHEIDTGVRDGMTTAEAQRVKELEREVKELRRANEILKLASAGLSNQLCNCDFSKSRQRQALFAEHQLEALQCRLPVVNRFPVFRRLADRQEQRLQR